MRWEMYDDVWESGLWKEPIWHYNYCSGSTPGCLCKCLFDLYYNIKMGQQILTVVPYQ